MSSRVDWIDLPWDVRDAIQARTGAVQEAQTAAAGLNSEIALFLRTTNGTIFVKGRRNDHPGVVTQQREAMINPYVRHLTAGLLWRLDISGWNILAFEYVLGRHADYSPNSDDLPKVIETIRRLGQTPCPDLPLKRAEQRWADYLDDRQRELLHGDALLHTDLNPVNVLITGNAARIVDWAWPTRGAAFIDPACLAVRLISAGHTPAQAETWARRSPAWTTAPAEAIDVFALAISRMWMQIASTDPQPWKKKTAAAAHSWARYRHGIAG
jgi:Phosphotransferase enzyme family